MIVLTDVSQTFLGRTGAVEALRGMDLQVDDGEFVAVVGRSGCGKSTLLRIIAGLGSPSAGIVDWPTSSHDASGEAHPDLGFVFQDPTLMPWANALKNTMLPLTLAGAGKSEAESRAAEMLALVGLKGFEKSYPRELSGGMKMRASIARALVTEPRLLLMDEPFAALDEITRFRLNNDLLALWQSLDKTVVFVTHSVFESIYLSNRVVVMTPRPGRVFGELPIEVGTRDARFRTSAAYAAFCRAASDGLAEATAPAGGP